MEDIDPISLEPIADLTYPPFEVKTDPTSKAKPSTPGATHLFDGRLLAVYMVSSSKFEDPINRRALTLNECKGKVLPTLVDKKIGVNQINACLGEGDT